MKDMTEQKKKRRTAALALFGLVCILGGASAPIQTLASEAGTGWENAADAEQENAAVQASKAELIYELEEPFAGDGSSAYVDTEIKLYDGSLEDWIVIACISNDMGSGDNVFFACFSEEEPYRGLLLRNPTSQSYEFICGNAGQTWNYTGESTYFTVAVQKKGNTYTLMYDGAIIYELESENILPYDGNLLIGCEEDPQGKKYRFGNTTVESLEVYSGTQSPSLTAARMEELLEREKGREGELQSRVLVDREKKQDELTPLETLKKTLQENGRVLLLLAAGFVISCAVVYMIDRNRKKREDK